MSHITVHITTHGKLVLISGHPEGPAASLDLSYDDFYRVTAVYAKADRSNRSDSAHGSYHRRMGSSEDGEGAVSNVRYDNWSKKNAVEVVVAR